MVNIYRYGWAESHHRDLFDFVSRLMKNLETKNNKFAEIYEIDYPLRYHERGMYSLFSISLAPMTNVILSEIPVGRRSTGEDEVGESKGRADLWCHLNDMDIIIELKRVAVGLKGENQANHKKLQSEWLALQGQYESAQEHLAEWVSGYQLGILVVFPWAQDVEVIKKWSHKDGEKFVGNIHNALGRRCKFIAKIPIPKKFRTMEVGGGNKDEFTPFVLVAGMFDKIK